MTLLATLLGLLGPLLKPLLDWLAAPKPDTGQEVHADPGVYDEWNATFGRLQK